MKTGSIALFLIAALAVVAGPEKAAAQAREFDSFIILIDQSGEMNKTYQNQSLNLLARERAKDIIKFMPPTPDLKGAIIMYGIMAAETKDRTLKVQKMAPFDMKQFLAAMEQVDKQIGPSTLSVALREAKDEVAKTPGWTAVFVISGGNLTDVDKAEERAKELKQSKPSLCIYPILIGKSQLGGKHLKEVAERGKCGFSITGDSVNSDKEMRRFLELIFPPQVAGPKDSDGDGVPDDRDKCPDTPFGAQADEIGCWSVNAINFDVAKWDIKPQYYPLLDEIAAVMNANPDLKITIVGHTDSDGADKDNLTLSERRALAVMTHLSKVGEVDSTRLKAIGMGESQPIAPNDTPAGKAKNRRIEFMIQKG